MVAWEGSTRRTLTSGFISLSTILKRQNAAFDVFDKNGTLAEGIKTWENFVSNDGMK